MANQMRNEQNGRSSNGSGNGGGASTRGEREGRSTGTSGRGEGPQRHDAHYRGSDTTLGYGDYGHPTEGGRDAYGDMGFGGGHPEERGMRDERGGTRPERGGAGTRGRRWRRGGQAARDVMTRNPRSVRPTESVQRIAQLMVDEDTGIIPVTDEDNRLLGVVTDRDVVCRLVARGLDMKTAKASDVMTDDVECVTERDSLSDVLRVMSEHQVRRVPVVAQGDRLVGIIAMADVAREADVDEELQDTFEEVSSERSFWTRLR